jgi:hypothetical protein
MVPEAAAVLGQQFKLLLSLAMSPSRLVVVVQVEQGALLAQTEQHRHLEHTLLLTGAMVVVLIGMLLAAVGRLAAAAMLAVRVAMVALMIVIAVVVVAVGRPALLVQVR